MVGIRLAPALQPKRLAIVGSHRTAAANIGFAVGLRPRQLSRQDTDAQAPAAPILMARAADGTGIIIGAANAYKSGCQTRHTRPDAQPEGYALAIGKLGPRRRKWTSSDCD